MDLELREIGLKNDIAVVEPQVRALRFGVLRRVSILVRFGTHTRLCARKNKAYIGGVAEKTRLVWVDDSKTEDGSEHRYVD